MYETVNNDEAYQNFWEKLRPHLFSDVTPPTSKDLRWYDHASEAWTAPDMILSHTCMYPYLYDRRDNLRYVATPHFDVPGCVDYKYCSFLITHKDMKGMDLKRLVQEGPIAINEKDSLTGCIMLAEALDLNGVPFTQRFDVVHTTSHRESIRSVSMGETNFASIDCVTWYWVMQKTPELAENVLVMGKTPKLPALPFVTSIEFSDDVFTAIKDGFLKAWNDNKVKKAAEALRIKGISIVPEAEFQELKKRIDQNKLLKIIQSC